MPTKILATASYVPETRRTNADLEKMLGTDLNNGGTTDKWIMERVGIKERRIAQPHESHLYMASHAIKNAVDKAGIDLKEASIVLAGNTHLPGLVPCVASQYATEWGNAAFDIVTRDVAAVSDACVGLFSSYIIRNEDGHLFGEPGRGTLRQALIYQHRHPALAQTLARELGMNAGRSYDVVTGCASYNFALALADAAIKDKPQHIVVAAVDKMGGVVNEKDRNSIVLFGELASATVLGPSTEEGFVAHHLETDGTQRNLITVNPYFSQDGRAVYKWAVSKIEELTMRAVEESMDVTGSRLFMAPHQANPRMLEAAMRKEIFKKVYGTVVTGDMFGNSSTASIAHALDVVLTEGVLVNGRKTKPEKGDYVGVLGFGAGLSSAVNVYRMI